MKNLRASAFISVPLISSDEPSNGCRGVFRVYYYLEIPLTYKFSKIYP